MVQGVTLYTLPRTLRAPVRERITLRLPTETSLRPWHPKPERDEPGVHYGTRHSIVFLDLVPFEIQEDRTITIVSVLQVTCNV